MTTALVSAFALWGIVQLAPGLPGNAVLNDIVIVLSVVDLAIIVSPGALRRTSRAVDAWRDRARGLDNRRVLFALEHVSYTRGDRLVLDDVSVGLANGTTALVGPSGAGKSTLLRLLNRLADPDSGRVLYQGCDVRGYDVLELRRQVALVPQLPALLPGSVEENVRYGPRLASRQCDVSRALTLAGLDDRFAQRRARELSVGEQQRVMLARALALAPAVLLLDEPTSALDEQARDAVERTLLELRQRLTAALIIVTHDQDQATRLSDHILRLEGGKIQPSR